MYPHRPVSIKSNLGYGLGLAIADINNDGWMIFISATTFMKTITTTLIMVTAPLLKVALNILCTTAASAWAMM